MGLRDFLVPLGAPSLGAGRFCRRDKTPKIMRDRFGCPLGNALHGPFAFAVEVLGAARSARGGICVFFATGSVFKKSVTVQDAFLAAMSRTDNSGAANGAEANTNANSVVSARHHLHCDCSVGSRSR